MTSTHKLLAVISYFAKEIKEVFFIETLKEMLFLHMWKNKEGTE